MKRVIIVSLLLISFLQSGYSQSRKEETAKEKIQVAILLDVSGSMEGLIDQARARLWNIVNTLTTLKYHGKTPHIEIALYEYGSANQYGGDYIRRIVPLSTDLDRLSAELFALKTSGSEEYCGTVIQRAVNELEWSNNKNDMKLIYIAGNEIFEQGKIPYKNAIEKAVANDIYVNTIHCGIYVWGVRDYWEDAAHIGKGKFFNIDHNADIQSIDTPFDAKIIECNARLNDTYIGYGARAVYGKEMQLMQDQNALSVSVGNYAERSISKSDKGYINHTWDLVDLINEDENKLTEIKKEDLPTELRDKSVTEIKNIIKQKEKERTQIQAEVTRLAKQRQAYINEQNKNNEDKTEDDLGKAITESVIAFAQEKGYTIEN